LSLFYNGENGAAGGKKGRRQKTPKTSEQPSAEQMATKEHIRKTVP